MADLKPCPFCGSEEVHTAVAEVENWIAEVENWLANVTIANHYVMCEGCGAAGRSETTEEKAVESWNRRYEDAICFCRDCHWYEDGEHKGECRLHKIKVKKNGYCFEAWRK